MYFDHLKSQWVSSTNRCPALSCGGKYQEIKADLLSHIHLLAWNPNVFSGQRKTKGLVLLFQYFWSSYFFFAKKSGTSLPRTSEGLIIWTHIQLVSHTLHLVHTHFNYRPSTQGMWNRPTASHRTAAGKIRGGVTHLEKSAIHPPLGPLWLIR